MAKRVAASRPKILEVSTLSKGKRCTLFLADFFLTFIIALSFFHLAVRPLGGLIIHESEQYEAYQIDAKARDGVLYGTGLLYHDEKTGMSENDLTANLAYTCQQYVGTFVAGLDPVYDVFSAYGTLTSSRWDHIAICKQIDAQTAFFTFDGTMVLKDVYVEEFLPYFRTGDAPSEQGANDYARFRDKFFLPVYSKMLSDIMEHDLVCNGVSYRDTQNRVGKYNQNMKTFLVASALISQLLAGLVVYLLFPYANKGRRTLGGFFLRRYRIDVDEMGLMKRSKIPLTFLYGFVTSCGGLVFVPWGAVGFNELFALPMLFALSLIALAVIVGSLAFLLSDMYNRSLSDRLSGTIVVDEDTMYDVYRAKGYDF